jgi:hypothetical protein
LLPSHSAFLRQGVHVGGLPKKPGAQVQVEKEL